MKRLILLSLFWAGFTTMGISQTTYTSNSSGNWNTANIWTPSAPGGPGATANVIILAEHTVGGNNITRTGNTTVHGRLEASNLTFNGNNQLIDGTGTISTTGTFVLNTGTKLFPSSADIIIEAPAVNIVGNIVVTNNGIVTIGSNLTGSLVGSTWTNNPNSTLNISGTLLTTGTLNAFESGNTVNYFGAVVTLKLPSLFNGHYTYHNLIISGSNTKTIPDAPGINNLAVNGDLTIYSTLSGNGGDKILRLRGNWFNYGNFTEGAGTIVFDGTNDQLIIRPVGAENFNNLTIHKLTGKVILNTNVLVSTSTNSVAANRSTLTLLSGNIDCGNNKLILGRITTATIPVIYTGNLVWTAGSIVGEFERFINHDWDNTRTYLLSELVFYSGSWWKSLTNSNLNNVPAENANWTASGVLFPIGTSASHRPANIFFNTVTPGSVTAKFNPLPIPGNSGLPLTEDGVTLYNTFRDGYWSLAAGNGLVSTDYNLHLTGNGFTGFSVTQNTRLLTRANSSSPWTLNGAHENATGNTVKRNSISLLSAQYCFGDDTDCLAPVDPVITGAISVCQNTAGFKYSVINTGNTYNWTVVGGTYVAGAGPYEIEVTWGTGQTGSVSVVETNGCTSSAEVILNVTVNPIPPLSITGRANVPENGPSPITYSTPSQTGYTHLWSVIGGTIVSGQNTNSITVNWGSAGIGSVCVTSSNACGTSQPTCILVKKYTFIASVKNGQWGGNGNNNPWDCSCTPTQNDNVVISPTHTVTLNNPTSSAKSLVISTTGSLSTGGNRTLNLYGDLTVYGNGPVATNTGAIISTGSITMVSSGGILDGTGSINNTGSFNLNANITIDPNANLTRTTGLVSIGADAQVTNNGKFTLGGNISGSNASSTWINASSASLIISGSLLVNQGILNSNAIGNTIHYAGGLTQIIKSPSSSYYNLTFSGIGEKTAPVESLLVEGDFTDLTNNAGASTFNANAGTIEFNGATSTITNTNPVSFYNLTVSPLSSLTSSAGTINVLNNFTNNGTFNHNNGTVTFNGSTPSLITGATALTTFNNITSGNPAGVSVERNLNLLGVLTVNAGAFDADGSVNTSVFTLKSFNDRPTQDASIGVIGTGASVVGNITAERFISGQGRINRYISSPLTNVPVSQLQDDFSVTGPFSGSSFPCTGCPNNKASLKFYNELVPGTLEKGYVDYPAPSGSNSNTLVVGKGYLAFMYRNINLTWDVTGAVNQGLVPLPLTFTASAAGINADGWNLVGNPYPSSIKWGGSSDWIRTNIDPVISVPDLSITTGYPNYYQSYNWVDDSGDPAAGVIAMGQAFWVKANAANPSLSIRETAKTGSGAANFYRVSSPSEQLVIAINNGKYEDKSYLKLNPAATLEFDPLLDGHKLKNEFMNVYLLDNDLRNLVMHTLPGITMEMKLPLGIEVKEAGEYHLNFRNFENFSLGSSLYLIDSYEGVTSPVSSVGQYSFKMHQTTQPLTDRFYLSLNNEVEKVSDEILLYFPNPVKDVLNMRTPGSKDRATTTIFDSNGKMMLTNEWVGESSVDMRNYPPGMYIFKTKTNNGVVVKKIIKND